MAFRVVVFDVEALWKQLDQFGGCARKVAAIISVFGPQPTSGVIAAKVGFEPNLLIFCGAAYVRFDELPQKCDRNGFSGHRVSSLAGKNL